MLQWPLVQKIPWEIPTFIYDEWFYKAKNRRENQQPNEEYWVFLNAQMNFLLSWETLEAFIKHWERHADCLQSPLSFNTVLESLSVQYTKEKEYKDQNVGEERHWKVIVWK